MEYADGKAIWEQQPGEPDFAYKLFEVYAAGGPTRSARRACAVWNDAHPDTPVPETTVAGWQSRWSWRERAQAYMSDTTMSLGAIRSELANRMVMDMYDTLSGLDAELMGLIQRAELDKVTDVEFIRRHLGDYMGWATKIGDLKLRLLTLLSQMTTPDGAVLDGGRAGSSIEAMLRKVYEAKQSQSHMLVDGRQDASSEVETDGVGGRIVVVNGVRVVVAEGQALRPSTASQVEREPVGAMPMPVEAE